MPPMKSRRLFEASPEEIAAEEPHVATPLRLESQPDLNEIAGLVRLPLELFDAIVENYEDATPLDEFYYTFDFPTVDSYYERINVFTALSQTCRSLREMTLYRLWDRLDNCRVPRTRTAWSKYVMVALERKAKGMVESPVRHYVRDSKPDTALEALHNMLPNLPNLRTIHMGDWKLELPNVTTLFIPDSASVFQRICPNAVHIRCVGGPGKPVISQLTDTTEVFDGRVYWTDPKVIDRLVKKAPNLRKLEIRSSDAFFYIYRSVDWVTVVSRLAPLDKLSELILSFATADERPSDAAGIAAARLLLQQSGAIGERRLVIRRFDQSGEYKTSSPLLANIYAGREIYGNPQYYAYPKHARGRDSEHTFGNIQRGFTSYRNKYCTAVYGGNRNA
ncbi:hypothetical protein B0H17DRAFT_1126365 [Mycena rosella]|uniref:Uncharacterized protein n=1 Tax=Mycena rosella TaxID=1033263 RepID=A0AAD7GUF5_MYCRO|nr:hypothetical protein B0H17DRAFT_1126365 [Mycena rosella]